MTHEERKKKWAKAYKLQKSVNHLLPKYEEPPDFVKDQMILGPGLDLLKKEKK